MNNYKFLNNNHWDVLYNDRALIYDEYSKYQDKDNKALQALLRYVNFSGKSVLEIGCGSGMYTSILANISKKYLAVDLSLPLLKLAKLKYNNPKKIKYIKTSADNISVGSNKFHIIFSSWGFPPYGIENEAQKECERLIKNGGEIWILTNYPQGEFMKLRGKIESIEKTKRFDWYVLHGYSVVEVVKSKFNFPNAKRAKAVLHYVFGDEVDEYLKKCKNPNIEREIAILKKTIYKSKLAKLNF